MSDKLWNLGTTGAAAVSGMLANKLSESIWKKVSGGNMPDDPQDPGLDWGRAIAFAVLSGALMQLLRMIVNRQATRTYIRATGHHPKA